MDVNLIADQSQSEEFIKIMKLNVHYNLLKSLYLNKGIIREVTMYLNKGIIRKVTMFLDIKQLNSKGKTVFFLKAST